MNYTIKQVSTYSDLKQAYQLFETIFAGQPIIDNDVYSLQKWEENRILNSELMLYAKFEHQVIGMLFGKVNKDRKVTLSHICVLDKYRNMGIASEMVIQFEENVKKKKLTTIRLGAIESAETFYYKLGYKGVLLVQSMVHSIDELMSLKSIYPVIETCIYEGKVSQLTIQADDNCDDLKNEYEKSFEGCYTMMMYEKIV